MVRLLLLAVLLLASMAVVPVQAADDHIVARGILEDPAGQLTVAEVDGMAFQPAPAIIAKGYTASVFWLRLEIRPSEDGTPLVLRVRPAYLDLVTLYHADPTAPSGWRERASGDRIPFADREVSSAALGFLVDPTPRNTVYFLRIASTSTILVQAEALERSVAGMRDRWLDLRQYLTLSIMIAIWVWAVNDYVLRRDRVIGLFVVSHFAVIVYNTFIMGYGAFLFASAPSGFVDAVTSLGVLLSGMLSILTGTTLIRQARPRRITLLPLDAMIALGVLAVVLFFAGQVRFALQLNAMLVLLVGPFAIVAVFTTRIDAPPGRKALRIAYSAQSVALLMTMVPLVGLSGATSWNLDAMLVHGLLSALPMFLLLRLRSIQQQRRAAEMELHLGLARQQLAIERAQTELQGRFLAMLTHELRTPIAVARMAVTALRGPSEQQRLIGAAFDNMEGIIERTAYADRLEQDLLEVRRERIDIAAMLASAAARSAAANRIRIEAQRPPPIVTDRHLLSVVLDNLVDNAAKYSAPGSTIGIRAAAQKHEDTAGFGSPSKTSRARRAFRNRTGCSRSSIGRPVHSIRAARVWDSTSSMVWSSCSAARSAMPKRREGCGSSCGCRADRRGDRRQ